MLYCGVCGSRHLQHEAWVTVNGDEFVNESEREEFYCRDCEDLHPWRLSTEDRSAAAKLRLERRGVCFCGRKDGAPLTWRHDSKPQAFTFYGCPEHFEGLSRGIK